MRRNASRSHSPSARFQYLYAGSIAPCPARPRLVDDRIVLTGWGSFHQVFTGARGALVRDSRPTSHASCPSDSAIEQVCQVGLLQPSSGAACALMTDQVSPAKN